MAHLQYTLTGRRANVVGDVDSLLTENFGLTRIDGNLKGGFATYSDHTGNVVHVGAHSGEPLEVDFCPRSYGGKANIALALSAVDGLKGKNLAARTSQIRARAIQSWDLAPTAAAKAGVVAMAYLQQAFTPVGLLRDQFTSQHYDQETANPVQVPYNRPTSEFSDPKTTGPIQITYDAGGVTVEGLGADSLDSIDTTLTDLGFESLNGQGLYGNGVANAAMIRVLGDSQGARLDVQGVEPEAVARSIYNSLPRASIEQRVN